MFQQRTRIRFHHGNNLRQRKTSTRWKFAFHDEKFIPAALWRQLRNIAFYYMAESASRQDEVTPEFLLATQTCKMGPFCPLRDSPERKCSLFGHIINPSLTKLVRSRYVNIGLVLFCVFVNLDVVSINKNASSRSIKTQKKKRGQYSSILTSTWSITYICKPRKASPEAPFHQDLTTFWSGEKNSESSKINFSKCQFDQESGRRRTT